MELRFLINTITKWDEPPRARHQVAHALSKKYSVVFVCANETGFPRCKIRKVEPQLEVFVPYFPVNYKLRYRLPFVNKVYQKWLFKQLRKNYADSVAINFDFSAKYLHRYFQNNIYYCNDDHIGMTFKHNPRWIAMYHQKCELQMAQHSDFCIGTSNFLVERLRLIKQQTYEIRLGAPEVKQYLTIDNQISRQDEKIIKVGIVGFFNTIDNDLLEFLLAKDDLQITLIGPISKKNQKRYSDRDNLIITGSLTGDDLNKALDPMDIGLIPYNLKSNIDRTPNKLWLYLSVGKPVVISNIKGIREWNFPDRCVYKADSYSQFYDLIKQATREDNGSLRIKRQEFAESNSWDVRMEKLLELVYQRLH